MGNEVQRCDKYNLQDTDIETATEVEGCAWLGCSCPCELERAFSSVGLRSEEHRPPIRSCNQRAASPRERRTDRACVSPVSPGAVQDSPSVSLATPLWVSCELLLHSVPLSLRGGAHGLASFHQITPGFSAPNF
ncbi:hypothetical protein AAFF_G00225050 [Aldrovandia affinis]|uniref:Uncharacterized protein n=1 Tax=Aldrovandia affinis TaxID=143900 RepID=A0AAD7TB06_9TELE|nr:hypothetical protein AAFF_G00225050 [Aldrovandia affinis]